MWYWKVVFYSFSRCEQITIVGEGYDTKEVAEFESRNWIKKFLPCLNLYRIVTNEVKKGVKR